MKHAKRMILVPEDVYARFEQKQKLLKRHGEKASKSKQTQERWLKY